MGSKVGNVKRGMQGSRNGRSRFERTEVLKKQSKKLLRQLGKQESEETRG
ncbi:hypothetical protein HUS23_07020 [Ectothiorhodospiraceae bacterium 2226]|nr:hypothetical protein HUS23_07020 [Ectothiorhodospiraceae bacterium 2226]